MSSEGKHLDTLGLGAAARPTLHSVSPSPQSVPVAAPHLMVVCGAHDEAGITAVAAHLAVSLAAAAHQAVCLVDLDAAGSRPVAHVLGLRPPRPLGDVLPGLRRGSASESIAFDGVVTVHPSRVHLMVWGATNPRQSLDPHQLTMLLKVLTQRYPFVVVAAGAAITEAWIAACEAADLLLFVTSPTLATQYHTAWMLGMMERLGFPAGMVKSVLTEVPAGAGKEAGQLLPCEVIAELSSVSSLGSSTPLQSLAHQLLTKTQWYLTADQIPRRRQAQTGEVGAPRRDSFWFSRLSAHGNGPSPDEPRDAIVVLKQRVHDQLVDVVEMKSLAATLAQGEAQIMALRERTAHAISSLLVKENQGVIVSQEVFDQLVREITDEVLGLGPLEDLLADPDVTDILVNSYDQIYIERRGRLELTARRFMSNAQLLGTIERIASPLGRRIDESSPMVDARLPDGSRINAIIPPLSLKGPILSIRKFSRVRYSSEDVIRLGTLTPEMMAFLRACVLARKNILISGGTGSGKTTLLNVLSSFIDPRDRIITIEDAAELKLAQTHWVSLEMRPANIEGKGQVTMRDLFRNALRMRPDRIIIGECRGEETLDMLQAMNTGHEGSLTTVHANSPRDVMSRIDSMVLMSNIELPLRAIREMIASGIHVIVHMARLPDGSRKITSISEITGMAHVTEVQLQELFVYRYAGIDEAGMVCGDMAATGRAPTFLAELSAKGIGLDARIFSPPAPTA